MSYVYYITWEMFISHSHVYIIYVCVCECMYMYVKFMINEVKKLIFRSFKMALITT